MSPSDLLFAAMLLSAPMGTPELPPTPERWPVVRDALHQTAVDWEILDARERRYVLTKREDFQDDLDFLRKRRSELAEAPRVIDAERLPDRVTINDCIRFNRSFRKNMELRIAWEADRAGFIREVIDENERLYKIWDCDSRRQERHALRHDAPSRAPETPRHDWAGCLRERGVHALRSRTGDSCDFLDLDHNRVTASPSVRQSDAGRLAVHFLPIMENITE